MNQQFRLHLFWIILAIGFSSCSQGPKPLSDILRGSIDIQVNPFGKVPLGAQLLFRTKEPTTVSFTINGRLPVSRSFKNSSRSHRIPVTGLYPDTTNLVTIILKDEKDRTYTGEITIATDPLPDFFPDIDITILERAEMEPGFHLVEMLIANSGLFHSYTILFDDNEDVRWYMDMSSAEKICYSPLRLKNGNWLYLSWIDLYELDELGQVIRKDQMWGNAGDHDLIELPNGNLLMGGSKKDASVLRDGKVITTRYDHIVEWERAPSGRTVREWDLGAVLDVDRTVFPDDFSLDNKADWFHVNSIEYNQSDNSVLASGRNQGVVKIDGQRRLQWILAPHKAWGKAGRAGKGFETSNYLLTAVDADGNPYPESVQDGNEAGDGFEWTTGQHAITVLENGNILLFDNGLSRNFKTTPTYSRAVEYAINEKQKTVRQVWEYGKDRGLDLFSGITSDVDVLPETGNRLITAGNVRLGVLPPHAKLVEITYPENKEVFEANVFFKDLSGSGVQSWAQFDLVYRGERYPLYHQ